MLAKVSIRAGSDSALNANFSSVDDHHRGSKMLHFPKIRHAHAAHHAQEDRQRQTVISSDHCDHASQMHADVWRGGVMQH